MAKRVLIRIRPDGSLEAETEGITGPDCLPYISAIEAMTDATTIKSHFTDEYYEGQQATGAEAVRRQEAELEQ